MHVPCHGFVLDRRANYHQSKLFRNYKVSGELGLCFLEANIPYLVRHCAGEG